MRVWWGGVAVAVLFACSSQVIAPADDDGGGTGAGEPACVTPADCPREVCHAASCVTGSCEQSMLPTGTDCAVGQVTGTCNNGECLTIGCDADSQCNDANSCTLDFCVQAMCVYDDVIGPAPEGQVDGDCRLLACDAGALLTQNDVNDVPDDMNPCTVDACDAGTPTHQPEPDGTPCGTTGQLCVSGVCQ
jgi:hypothetical protein